MEFDILRLPNGLRVLHVEDANIMTVHCGFIINAGSRDETHDESGIAHLIEHGLFKGTQRRKAFHILTRIDSVGGEINAYTTKEETCVYATALKEHFERAAELLVDVTFSSKFPEKEIKKEISVIKDEINSYKDNPDEMLVDEFEELMYPEHSLGRPILGSEENISSLTRTDIKRFVDRLYKTDQIVFACVGNLSKRKLRSFCKRILEPIQLQESVNVTRVKPKSAEFKIEKKANVHQVHSLIGKSTFGLDDDRVRTMVMLNNILGGPALNSRLNLKIREKMGYCYYIESHYNAYTDCGIFEIYFGTDKRHFNKVNRLIKKELDILKDRRLTDRMLTAAHNQLIGQIAVSQENLSNLMLTLGKSLLHFDRVDSFAEMKKEIESITAREIQDLATELFESGTMSQLSYVPE